MLTATLPASTLSPAVEVTHHGPSLVRTAYRHLVTLYDARTGAEKSLVVETATDRFVDVWREVCHLRAALKLQSFQVFEVLELTDSAPF